MCCSTIAGCAPASQRCESIKDSSTSKAQTPKCPNPEPPMLLKLQFSWWERLAIQSSRRSLSTRSPNRLDAGLSPPEPSAYAAVLRRSAHLKDLSEGQRIHACILKTGHDQDTFLGNLLVEMYGKCGSLQDACAVFERMPTRNVFSWSIMIDAYAQNGHSRDALLCFRRMDLDGVKPDKFIFTTALHACTNAANITQGMAFQARIIESGLESDVAVGTSLVNMHGKCGTLSDAVRAFEGIQEKNVVSWTAMIVAYAQNGQCREALERFRRMDVEGVKPNRITFLSLLDACSSLSDLAQGRLIHARFEHDLVPSEASSSALVNMYGKCGKPEEARCVFERMSKRNVVSWTAMVAAYAQNGHGREALELFQRMDMEGIKQDVVAFVSALDACASLASLAQGKLIHARILASEIALNVFLGTALVNMYSKCGTLDAARSIFEVIPGKTIISWNTILAAYAQHGLGMEALRLFNQLKQEGSKPNSVTFISAIAACSHNGLVQDAFYHFKSMVADYWIAPTAEHYGCLIDLLGRVGRLAEAEEFVERVMPAESRVVQWKALLAACKVHGDVKRGARAAERLLELDPKNDAPYVLLSSLYADADRKRRRP